MRVLTYSNFRHGRLLHRFWYWWEDHGLPLWFWRPWCWRRWHVDDSYGGCVVCGLKFWRRR